MISLIYSLVIEDLRHEAKDVTCVLEVKDLGTSPRGEAKDLDQSTRGQG